MDNNSSNLRSRPDGFEMQSEIDTDIDRDLVKDHGGDIGWTEGKGGIRVQRTIEVTRHSESDGSPSIISVEGASTPWAGPSGSVKDERDMV